MTNTLRFNATILDDAAVGRILIVSFAGFYPSGSRGSDTAAAMFDFSAREKARHYPVALLLDCTQLDYCWGDGPISLLLRLWREDRQRGIHCPMCFVAPGSTGQALKNLLATCGTTRLIYTSVVDNMVEGIDVVRSSIL